MGLSEYVKSKGAKSILEVVRISGVAKQTLVDWYQSETENRRFILDAVIEKAVRKKDTESVQ